MIENIESIIFDYSGTLRDDLDWTFEITMRVFEKMGRGRITLEEYQSEMCLPYMNFYRKYFPGVSQKEIDFLFLCGMQEVQQSGCKLYRGVLKVLELLVRRSVKMVILSSCFHYELIREAEMLGLKKYFPWIFGSVHDKVAKMSCIIKMTGFNPVRTLVVGDMAHDIEAGKIIGAKTVALTWGYWTRERLEKECSPDYIVDSLPEILLL